MGAKQNNQAMGVGKVNPLRDEYVRVRFVPQPTGFGITDKSHVGFGGLFEGNAITLCVPMQRNGKYKNILTNDEKDYLEDIMGLDSGALSVYNTVNNYWDDFKIRIEKDGLKLHLSEPLDYIKYKVLLANSDVIAPSVEERVNRPKATYRFEIVKEGEEDSLENVRLDATRESWKEFGKIENDADTLRVLIEQLDGRPYSASESLTFLNARVLQLIEKDAKRFLQYIKDPMLHTKMLLRRGMELGKISMKNDYYYLASTGAPLCEQNEKSTLSIAAKYLNQPANQEIKFMLESEIAKNKN